MQRLTPALGSALFFLLAPSVVAGLVPWWLTGWRMLPAPLPLRAVGVLLLLGGVPVLVSAFVRFVREGAGTPAPVAPTEHLVVGGLYGHVRNPMYLAVVSTVVGQGLLLGQWSLLLYAAVLLPVFLAFVRLYEEPVLRERYGAEYEAYRRAVPGWLPRLRPWKG